MATSASDHSLPMIQAAQPDQSILRVYPLPDFEALLPNSIQGNARALARQPDYARMELALRPYRALAALLSIAVAMSGCAMSPQQYYAKREAWTDHEVCQTFILASKAQANYEFIADLRSDAAARGQDHDSCVKMVDDGNRKAALAFVAVLGVIAIAAVARNGGGGGGGYNGSASDSSWEWDEFYNAQYQLVWACRGVQTGQFSEQYHCQGKSQSDWKWPSKSAQVR